MKNELQLMTVLAAAVALSSAGRAEPQRDFPTTLAAHLKAISDKDLPGIVRTITARPGLDLYLPDGRRLTTRAEFVAFHTDWFRETAWSMRFEPVSTIVGRDVAVATVRSHYKDVVDGKPYASQNWLSLTFRLEDGGWKLVQDQNTRIPPPQP